MKNKYNNLWCVMKFCLPQIFNPKANKPKISSWNFMEGVEVYFMPTPQNSVPAPGVSCGQQVQTTGWAATRFARGPKIGVLAKWEGFRVEFWGNNAWNKWEKNSNRCNRFFQSWPNLIPLNGLFPPLTLQKVMEKNSQMMSPRRTWNCQVSKNPRFFDL